MMEIRRNLLMMGAREVSIWKQKQISPSADITGAADVLTWIESELSKLSLSTNAFICVCRDNVDQSTWQGDDFVSCCYLKDQTGAKTYSRCRGNPFYLQSRNFVNNDTATVYANETYTIFYQ